MILYREYGLIDNIISNEYYLKKIENLDVNDLKIDTFTSKCKGVVKLLYILLYFIFY